MEDYIDRFLLPQSRISVADLITDARRRRGFHLIEGQVVFVAHLMDDVPVICGGVEFHPGDVILGDCDGVVVVPQEQEDEVFEKGLAKYEKEQYIVEQFLAGKTTLEIYGFDKLIDKLEKI